MLCTGGNKGGRHIFAHYKMHPRLAMQALGVSEEISGHLRSAFSIVDPTEIQALVIPKLLRSHSRHPIQIAIQAQTGSGKTLSFLIPIVQQLLSEKPGKLQSRSALRCLIICPTKELAQQTFAVAERLLRLSQSHGIVPGVLNGADRRKSEKARIRKGLGIVVATPGRLLDHLEQTECFLTAPMSWIVVDEADRLLDLGFAPKLRRIISLLKPKARPNIVCCSATFPEQIQELFRPIAGAADEFSLICSQSKVPATLSHHVFVSSQRFRSSVLVSLLKESVRGGEKAIVFFSCCDSAIYFGTLLPRWAKAIGAESLASARWFTLHGNMQAAERRAVLGEFLQNSGECRILCCTDVAARGLDIYGITKIVQYDAPQDLSDYIHRAGRTARAAQSGDSSLVLATHEVAYVDYLRKEANALSVTTEESISNFKRFGWFAERLSKIVAREEALKSLASKAFTSSVRAYSTHSKVFRAIFDRKSLHLGHLAYSFGLAAVPRGSLAAKKHALPEAPQKAPKKKTAVGEFDSGL